MLGLDRVGGIWWNNNVLIKSREEFHQSHAQKALHPSIFKGRGDGGNNGSMSIKKNPSLNADWALIY